MLSTNQIITWDVHVELVQRFLLILILLIPFEIRDLAYDNVGLRTMPQRYGVRNSKIFGVCVSLFFFFSTFMKDDLSSEELILKALLFVILLVMLGVTKKIQSKYFASFWVEALPILWYGSMLLVVRWF